VPYQGAGPRVRTGLQELLGTLQKWQRRCTGYSKEKGAYAKTDSPDWRAGDQGDQSLRAPTMGRTARAARVGAQEKRVQKTAVNAQDVGEARRGSKVQ
jgi:hypothetical protein